MRIVVMGSGGTGGFFGAKLARAGEAVTFVARGEHLRAIQVRGLTVKSATDGEWTVRADARERLDGEPPADLVLFCVKSFDTEAAAETVRPVVGPATGVLSIQNGVDNEDKLEAILGSGHVIAGIAEVFAVIEAPGVIVHTLLGRLRFGEMSGKDSTRVRGFLEGVRSRRHPGRAGGRSAPDAMEKYVFLVAQSGMSTVTRCPAGVLRQYPETRAMYERLMDELVRVGRAAGVELDAGLVAALMQRLDTLGAGAFSSLHYDFTRGKRLELEALQGHAVRLGERLGVPTPTLAVVYAALRPFRDGRPPQAAG
jgi:2-dehydropantoate 2-reductase